MYKLSKNEKKNDFLKVSHWYSPLIRLINFNIRLHYFTFCDIYVFIDFKEFCHVEDGFTPLTFLFLPRVFIFTPLLWHTDQTILAFKTKCSCSRSRKRDLEEVFNQVVTNNKPLQLDLDSTFRM